MALRLRYAFALAACTALLAPPARIQRCAARRATAEAAEAAKIISDNLEAFSQAATATDAGLAMARIYDATQGRFEPGRREPGDGLPGPGRAVRCFS